MIPWTTRIKYQALCDGTSRFWWTGAALALLVAAHGTYWLRTHPVNNFWVKDVVMAAPGSSFFSTFADAKAGDWTELRNRWELSHVIIACFATLSLISMAVATSLSETCEGRGVAEIAVHAPLRASTGSDVEGSLLAPRGDSVGGRSDAAAGARGLGICVAFI